MNRYWELKKCLPNERNQMVINEYLINIKAIRSKKTVQEYRIKLQFFFRETEVLFSSITMKNIEQWFDKKDQGKRKRASYLSTLRCFYAFCVEQGYIRESPIFKKIPNFEELQISLPNKTNQNVIEAFLKSKKGCLSTKTIQGYQYELRYFFQDTTVLFSSITTEDFKKWLVQFQKGRKKKTIYKCLNVVRYFYDYCVEQDYMKESPVKREGKKYWELKKTLPNEENQIRINEFLFYIKERKSEKVVEDFRINLQLFFKDTMICYSSIKTADIEEWMKEYQKGRKDKTVRKCSTALRYFYRFCVQHTYMLESPISNSRKKEQEKYWVLSKRLPNDVNQSVINEFLLSLKVLNLSKGSILSYRYFLEKFFLDKEEFYLLLEPDDIQNWFIENQKHLAESTIHSQLSIIASFYRFCVEEGYVETSPIKSRWFPRIPKSVPKFLEKEEIAKISHKSEEDLLRNRVLVEFLLSSGCRIGEVHRLNREDLNFEKRTAQVIGKGKKIRLVHFSEKCAHLLERYLESRKDDHPALFVSVWERRLSKTRARESIKELGKKAELGGHLYPHRLRHTFATELLAKGADLSFIADELGHENLQTTKIYAHLPKNELISLYRKYMG